MRFITVQSSERKKTDWRCTAVIKGNFIILTNRMIDLVRIVFLHRET